MKTATIITMSAILLVAVGCDYDGQVVVHEHYDVYPPEPVVIREVYMEHINSPQFVNTNVVVNIVEHNEPEIGVLLNVVDTRLAAISVEFEQARHGRSHDAQFSFAIIDAEYQLLYRLYHHIDRHYNHRRHRNNAHLRRRLADARDRITRLRQRNRRLRKKLADERVEADRLARQNRRIKKHAAPIHSRDRIRNRPANVTRPRVNRDGRTVLRTPENRSGLRTPTRVVANIEKNRIRRAKPKKGGIRPIIVKRTETRTVTRTKPAAVARVQQRSEAKQARIEKVAQVKQVRQIRQLTAQQTRETKQLVARQRKTERVASKQVKRIAGKEARQTKRATVVQRRETKKQVARQTKAARQVVAREKKVARTEAAKTRKQAKQSKREARRTRIAANLD